MTAVKPIEPAILFENSWARAHSRLAVLRELADAKAEGSLRDHEVDFWLGVLGIVSDVARELDAMQEHHTTTANALDALEHPEDVEMLRRHQGRRLHEKAGHAD